MPFLAAEASSVNTPGVTAVSQDIYHLHMTILYVCCGIAVVVFGTLFYSLFKYRKSKGAVASNFHENMTLEVVWAIAPFIILILMAIPATKVLLRMSDTSKPDITIKITGYQWRWQYEYLDEGFKFFSNLSTSPEEFENKKIKSDWYLLDVDNPLIVPIHKKSGFPRHFQRCYSLLVGSGVWCQTRCYSGFIHQAWTRIDKPGVYRGQCAELCGKNHGFMPIVVKAVSQEEYDAWLKGKVSEQAQAAAETSKEWTKDELMQTGQKTYETVCAACHKSDGSGMPPVFPALKASKIAVGPVADHINIVLHGKAGTAMQAFGPQFDDATLAAVITYERNAWGNDQSAAEQKVVQPSDVKKAREE